jgi:broad specificity phosphatase PhoE
MTPLLLLRHGPTGAVRQGAPLGRLDLPVDPEGQALWPRVRAQLLGLGLERVLCSPLARSREHALDLGLPYRILPGLAEQDFGEWDGRPWQEIPGTQAFFRDPVGTAPPGGESFRDCAARSVAALEEGLEDRPTLVLAHGGPLRAILAGCLGLPLERALDLAWDPFGLSRLERFPGAPGAEPGSGRCLLRYHNHSLPQVPGSVIL